ncbi:1039_t:CDS:2, partial [Dentiscutata heterogama]
MNITKNTIILFFLCILIASGVLAQAPSPTDSSASAPATTSAKASAASSVRVDGFGMIIGSFVALFIGVSNEDSYPDDNFECEFLDFGPDVDKSNYPSDDFDCEFYVNEDESYTTTIQGQQDGWRWEVFFKKTALQTPTLETFFGVTREKMSVNKAPIIESLEECEFEDIDEIDENEEQEKDSLKIAIVDLQKNIQQQNSPVLKLRLQAMFQYLNLLNRKWLKMDTAR